MEPFSYALLESFGRFIGGGWGGLMSDLQDDLEELRQKVGGQAACSPLDTRARLRAALFLLLRAVELRVTLLDEPNIDPQRKLRVHGPMKHAARLQALKELSDEAAIARSELLLLGEKPNAVALLEKRGDALRRMYRLAEAAEDKNFDDFYRAADHFINGAAQLGLGADSIFEKIKAIVEVRHV